MIEAHVKDALLPHSKFSRKNFLILTLSNFSESVNTAVN